MVKNYCWRGISKRHCSVNRGEPGDWLYNTHHNHQPTGESRHAGRPAHLKPDPPPSTTFPSRISVLPLLARGEPLITQNGMSHLLDRLIRQQCERVAGFEVEHSAFVDRWWAGCRNPRHHSGDHRCLAVVRKKAQYQTNHFNLSSHSMQHWLQ